jgi:hypothetical protein
VPTLTTSLLWSRTDTTGSDLALIDDRAGLRARGVVVAADPLPHTCRYEVVTDEAWTVTRVEVTAEGGGWLRTVRLMHAAGRWRITTSEQGDLSRALTATGRPPVSEPGTEDPDRLADAIDVDLGAAPLFNTLPVRRLGLLEAAPGTKHRLVMAWVDVPSLTVFRSEQTYTALGDNRINYASDGFTADLALDGRGFVTHYPGLANRT